MLERIAVALKSLAEVQPTEVWVSPSDFARIVSDNVVGLFTADLYEDAGLEPGQFRLVFGPLS